MFFFTGYGQSGAGTRHYVIIGAFSSLENAERFGSQAVPQGLTVNYARNEARGVYYVYVLDTENRKAAYSFGARIRKDTDYKDAWVFSGSLATLEQNVEQGTEIVEQPKVTPNKPAVEEEVVETQEEALEEEPVVAEQVTEQQVPQEEKEPAFDPNKSPYYFKLVSSSTGEEVSGQVYLFENEQANQYQTYRGNQLIGLGKPANAKQTYFVRVNAPGYYPIATEINYANTTDLGQSDNTTVKVDLERSRTGHYVEFNNVNFLANSAIFTPASQPELDAFVDLLSKNPKYRIRVHGHCNGKFERNATIRSGSENFFARGEGTQEVSVSAKKLTDHRAQLFKDYLVSNGIEANRIKTKAEGGSTMLFPQNGPLGGLNDRLEIEITKGK